LSEGTVKCWGDNYYGELGDGTTTGDGAPVAVLGLSGVTAITAGWSHTCAVLSGGTVECWGDDNDGQLGNGTNVEPSGATPCGIVNDCFPTPVTVSGLTGVTAIAAGTNDTCALLFGGTVECWGLNNYGQLGDATSSGPQGCNADPSVNPCSMTPVVVSGLAGAQAVALGQFNACALLSGGKIECWGWNDYGQLGNGTIVSSAIPVAVQGFSSSGD
jgi:alpha-tubulin suppressor-like RCC1 family protein